MEKCLNLLFLNKSLAEVVYKSWLNQIGTDRLRFSVKVMITDMRILVITTVASAFLVKNLVFCSCAQILKQNYGVGEIKIGITFEPHKIGQHITIHNVCLEALYALH